jgi:mercuric ion transport protein
MVGPEVGSARPSAGPVTAGWSAVAAAALAIFAWASCCALPLTLSVAGLGMTGTVWIAGQRGWLTLVAILVLAAGWLVIWRDRKACARDGACRVDTRLPIRLMTVATLLLIVALAWSRVFEPAVLSLLRSVR